MQMRILLENWKKLKLSFQTIQLDKIWYKLWFLSDHAQFV